tara:strand:+ start:23353 stop:23715 length:363 start_codon:yes stop_codon:yes gene_type:complete
MGDLGDYWREHREYKRALRMFWPECPTCAVTYGTGTKTPPGEACHNCGWIAPGERGSDKARAKAHLSAQYEDEQERAARKAEKRARLMALRTCRACGRQFKTERARINHERDAHKGMNNG